MGTYPYLRTGHIMQETDRLERIEKSLESLCRAVLGAPEEANPGLIGRMARIEERQNDQADRQTELSRRFDRVTYLLIGASLGGGLAGGSIVAAVARTVSGI